MNNRKKNLKNKNLTKAPLNIEGLVCSHLEDRKRLFKQIKVILILKNMETP